MIKVELKVSLEEKKNVSAYFTKEIDSQPFKTICYYEVLFTKI